MMFSMAVSAIPQPAPPRYSPRRHLWLKPGEPLVCPNGHKLKHNATVIEHGALVCQHRQPGQSGECGSRVYVLVMPRGRTFVAEVTPAETRYMLDQSMGVDEALRYLGAA